MRELLIGISAFLLAACTGGALGTAEAEERSASKDEQPVARELRLTGIVEAISSTKLVVPQLIGQGGQLTLIRLIPNGSRVRAGDVIAEFDSVQQLLAGMSARAKFDDLSHQVEQKAAQNRADAEKRRADLTQAQADLNKALLDLGKGEFLSEIARLQNETRAEMARQHVESLVKSNAFRDAADAAALRILELQRDRQKVAMERAETNMQRLQMRAPLDGIVAHQNIWRSNSMGRPQEGDQLWRGQALVSIFDPTDMRVRCAVGEPDNAVLKKGVRATVYFDAYPDLALPAYFESASPIASSALGSPIKTFTALFKLEKTDPRLMPDLSAAVVIEPATAGSR